MALITRTVYSVNCDFSFYVELTRTPIVIVHTLRQNYNDIPSRGSIDRLNVCHLIDCHNNNAQVTEVLGIYVLCLPDWWQKSVFENSCHRPCRLAFFRCSHFVKQTLTRCRNSKLSLHTFHVVLLFVFTKMSPPPLKTTKLSFSIKHF